MSFVQTCVAQHCVILPLHSSSSPQKLYNVCGVRGGGTNLSLMGSIKRKKYCMSPFCEPASEQTGLVLPLQHPSDLYYAAWANQLQGWRQINRPDISHGRQLWCHPSPGYKGTWSSEPFWWRCHQGLAAGATQVQLRIRGLLWACAHLFPINAVSTQGSVTAASKLHYY